MNFDTSVRFNTVYNALLVADVQRQLRMPYTCPSQADLAYALSFATLLSLTPDSDDENAAAAMRKAYELALRSLSLANGSTPMARAIADLVLARLGNFPARNLLETQHGAQELSDPFIRVETLVRQGENRLKGVGADILLTDFQARLMRSFERYQAVSVSAPTSAGKSFSLELELLRHLAGNEQRFVAAYLVPTRPLIRQVTFDLAALLRKHRISSVSILSAPSNIENTGDNKAIYVLTQERFASLLATDQTALITFDMLIVDEAHEVGERSRGVTLERALSVALSKFPTARLFFSSPLRSNPEFLLDLFDRRDESTHFVERTSPVSQNVIKIYPVSRKPNAARIELLVGSDNIAVGETDLGFPFRNRYMAHMAVHFTGPSENTIIYCNEPAAAEKVGQEIADLVSDVEADEELRDFAAFLRQEIHPDYRLSALIRKGVAFHYGNIPQIIRGRIEDLLRARKLRYVCCTSTLLQGMNLPAKNIFVENPKKGRGRPMQPGDFWNLVGRAGRLSKEFEGNVFCIFGKDWDADVTSTKLVPIESAFENAVQKRAPELLQAIRVPAESTEAPESSWAEQTFARIFADFVSTGKLLAQSKRDQLPEYNEIDVISESIERTLPDEIFVNNYYLHPKRLEMLANAFRERQDISALIPARPGGAGSFDSLVRAYELINDIFIHAPSVQYRYFAFLSNRWMSGDSLRELIESAIAWKKVVGAEAINDLIHEIFKNIETELRYKYVKYMRIYIDVLRVVLLERGLPERAQRLLPIHLFLEYGASSTTLINLMAIGLSRTSALLLKTQIGMRDDFDLNSCRGYVDRINLDLTDLPAVCKAEIARLRQPQSLR